MLESLPSVLPWAALVGCTLALLILPGWALLALARVPMRRLYGMAPPVTLAMLTVIGAVAHPLGIPYGRTTVLIGLLLMCLVAAALGRTLWRPEGATAAGSIPHGDLTPPSRPIRVLAAVAPALLALVAGAGWAVPAVRAIGSPAELAQSFDAFFHHSAIQEVRESGDVSPVTALAPLYNAETMLYPVGWHSVAALLPGGTTVAANSLVLATLLILPLTMLPLLDQLLPAGRARRAGLAVLVLLPAFLTFPSVTLRAGLWPYSLAVALLPALFAALLHVRRGRRADCLISRSAIVLTAVLGGIGSTHPATVFALVLIAPVLVIDAIAMVRSSAHRRKGVALLGLYVVAAVVLTALSVSRFETMSAFFGRLSSNSPLMALGIVLTDRPAYQAVAFAPLAVLLPWLLAGIGVLGGLRHRRIPAVGLAVGLGGVLLIMVSALVPGPLGPLLTWPWYGDRERLGPVLAIGVIALAGAGLQELVEVVGRLWRRRAHPNRASVPVGPLTAALVVALGVAASWSAGGTAVLASATYHPESSPYKVYVSGQEEEFIRDSSAELPEGSVVLGDPRDGTPLYSALGGHDVVFSYLQPPVDVPRKRVARYADQYESVPRVCAALRSTEADHLYRDSSADSGRSDATAEENAEFAGVNSLDVSELELVAQDGPYALYRLDVAC